MAASPKWMEVCWWWSMFNLINVCLFLYNPNCSPQWRGRWQEVLLASSVWNSYLMDQLLLVYFHIAWSSISLWICVHNINQNGSFVPSCALATEWVLYCINLNAKCIPESNASESSSCSHPSLSLLHLCLTILPRQPTNHHSELLNSRELNFKPESALELTS